MYQKIKLISLAVLASCMSWCAFAQSSAQDFVIKGNIKGIKNGTKVALRSKESGKYIEAECLSQGNSFVLKGKVEGTMLVQLCIDNKPKAEYKEQEYAEVHGGNFMLEPGNYQVSAACFDSIARNYFMYSVPMDYEKILKIVGGKVQQQYQEWADATYDARLNAALIDMQLGNARYGGRRNEVDSVAVNRLKPLVEKASEYRDKVNDQFIAAHPDYAISLLLKSKELANPFAMTNAEYDEMLVTFANNYDKSRYEDFVKLVNEMKKYIKGSHFKDLAVETVEGKPANLKDIVMPGKYNFLDFWASWCGPCRAAIPSVKKLHEKLGDTLNIVSISVDKKRADWEKAMAEEKMPWQQYLVPQSSMKALKDAYFLQFVPSLVVIDPSGHIVLFTSDPDEAHRYLEQKQN